MGKLFPGPQSIPLMGNTWIFGMNKKDAMTVMIELGKKYPTNRLWLGSRLVINISLPKDIEIVMKSSKTSKKSFVYKFMEPAITNSLMNGEGPKMRAHRKLLIPIINADLGEFDICHEAEYCLADIAYEVLFGIPGVAQDHGNLFIPHTIIDSLGILYHRVISPWLYPSFLFNLSKSGKIWHDNTKIVQDFFSKIINEKKKIYTELANNEPELEELKPSILDLLMAHVIKTNEMNDLEIKTEMITLFIGFYDTVLNLYSFMMLMLAMHIEEQEKVRREIITIFGTDGDVMEEDLGKLKYTEMVIKEVIRLFPVGPFLSREATDDLKLDEYTLPKGATVCMMPILTHRLEEHWDKPDFFIPERFLPENSKNRHPFAFIPFSGGSRSCPGSKFGMACLKVMTVHFIRKYQLRTTMKFNKLKLETHLSVRSVNGYKTVEGKLVVLGSQGVGKTSMIARYTGKLFNHHVSPTIGASFFTCKINLEDARIKLQVWDTAGQERFRSMAPMYYRNANAALLVFDITQYNTFTAIKSWVIELRRNIEESLVLVLVGNKCDLFNERKVDSEEGRKYATTIGASYHETSALNDEGIEQVFLVIALGLLRLANGDNDAPSLRIQDSPSSGISSIDSNYLLAPSSEESLAHSSSIAHGIHEKPPACC
ncbi:hypothetical protein PV326_001891 [Microctonus aethiopoides]|nr:hypothetical protein PV326_001891 [Microctonus aethiopoides]